MNAEEAFALLEIEFGATPKEIRRAWRNQSSRLHPDVGGSNEAMIELNHALDLALNLGVGDFLPSDEKSSHSSDVGIVKSGRRDPSSFTVNVLPVDCWLALEVVASLCGPTIHDEPPYSIEFLLHDSSLPASRNAWCRCECVPEAGATTVHLTVGATKGIEAPDVEEVRDFLVDQLNEIDWP